MRDFIVRLAAFVVLCVFVNFMFGAAPVNGQGMYPGLRDGDLVVFYKVNAQFSIGDVVTFKRSKIRRYGRIAACGGDTVDMTGEGQLMVNGSIQQEETVYPTFKDGKATAFPVTLKKDEVFVLGDNRVSTVDSRDFGPLPVSSIDGKVITLLRHRGI